MKKILLSIITIATISNASQLEITSGWQLKGSSQNINISSFNNPNISYVWGYDSHTHRWSVYLPNNPTYMNNLPTSIDKLNSIKANQGFWIYATNNTILTISKSLLIPAYFYDDNIWDNVGNHLAIINPNNGVGSDISTHYLNITNNHNTLGYIYTSYSHRDIQDIENEVDKYIEYYPNIKGFFFDEVNSSIDAIDYYTDIYNYVKNKGNYFITLNPGTSPNDSYYNIADSIVVYEGSDQNRAIQSCTRNKTTIIVYDINSTQMKNIIQNSNCDYFYITDDTLSNPYDTLPSYWDEEQNEINNSI